MGKITLWVKINIFFFLLGFSTQLYSFNSTHNNFTENYGDGICYVFAEAPEINQFGSNYRNDDNFSNKAAISISITTTAATCSDNADGNISIYVSGGDTPYKYKWSGNGRSDNSKDLANVKVGTYTVTVTDNTGNIDTATGTVTVTDNEAPVITHNGDKEINNDSGKCGANVTVSASATDNCSVGAVSGTRNDGKGLTELYPVGTTTISWNVSDANNNDAVSKTQTIVVTDNEVPVITHNGDKAVNNDSGKCGANVTVSASATDNCSVGAVSGTRNDGKTLTELYPVGTTTISWKVKDGNNNDAVSKTQTIVVTDNEVPVITHNGDKAVNNDSGKCGANVTVSASATDNCSVGAVSGTRNDGKGLTELYSVGTTTISWNVSDDNGNAAQPIVQTIIVNDTEPPKTPVLTDITWSCGLEITDFPVTTDNCSGEITGTTTDPLEYDTFGTYTITWTFTDNAGKFVQATQEIIIPEPTVERILQDGQPFIEGAEFCDKTTIADIIFEGKEKLEKKRFEWSYKERKITGEDTTYLNTNIGLSSSGSGDIPQFTAKNNTSEPIEAVFTVIPFGNGCEGNPMEYSITINPTPTITKPEDITLCAGKEISFSNFIPSVQGTKFTVESSNPDIQFTTNNKGNLTGINYNVDITKTIITTVTITPEKNCTGPAETFKITINPRPRFEFNENDFIFCNGIVSAPIQFSNKIPSEITYDISGGSSIGISNKSGVTEITSFTPVNNGTTEIIKNITVTPKANGCMGEPVIIPVTVQPSPIVNASYTKNICSGEVTNIILSSPVANTEFLWTVEAPTGIEGASQSTEPSNSISQQLTNNTSSAQVVTYKVTPKAETCPGTTIAVKITVNPTPSFEITIPECIASVDLTDPSIKNDSALSYSYWTDEDATASLMNPTKVGIGTYYIKGTSNSGCSFIEEVVIDKIQPVINNLADAPSEICSGEAFNYLPVSNLGETVISWSREAIGENPATDSSGRNNANPNESLINKTGSPITATYIFTLVNNGCTNNTAVEVIIQPAPQLINESIADICNGSSINYTPKSTLSNSTISWRRNAFEGNSASSGSGTINEILYNDTGVEIGVTYFISITSSKGCTVEESISFSLLSGPKVTATASKNDLCAGETIDLTSTFEGEQSVEPVLIDENFNGSTGNWLPINNSTGGSSNNSAWVTRNGTYNMNYGSVRSDGSRFYISDSDAQGQNGKTRTILQYGKPINTNGYSSLQLSFWQDYRDWNNNDRGQVQISTDQSNWVTVETIDGPGHRGEQLTIDLSGYINQASIYIRFRYIADWGYWWAIDDVKLTGEGSTVPDVTWTSSTNPDWTSKDPNPSNISVSRTTIFTATYTDPDIECPGVGTVEVRVKDPLQPEIIANYCSLDQTNQVLLSANGTYDSYRWVASGQTISTSESLQVGLAQTYTLFVTKDGCEASTSITPNENLIINGDFENGNTSFNTVYNYVQDDPNSRREMYPEGTYSVGVNAYNYHNNFSGLGHGGRGNFMIVNGDRSIGNIVWQSNTLDIIPDTDYYFSAWTSNVNPASPARLRIQILIPGNNTPVEESTLGDLTNETVGNWINFYNPELWNSGNNSKVIVRIINENPTAGGNDFGIDDISFAAFRSFDFEFNPENNGPICENETLELSANLDGGRLPITFEWTGPNNFSRSKTITEESERTAADTLQITNTTPEMAGEYSLKITDFYGCNLETKYTVVTIIEKAIVFAGEDLEICSDSPLINLSEASITHPTITSGKWSTESGDIIGFTDSNQINTTYNPSPEDIELGEINLILTSNLDSGAICETVSDTVNIKFNTSPEVNLVLTDVSCFNGNNGEIKAEITEYTGTPPFTYAWSDGQTGQVAKDLIAGGYQVTITDANECKIVSETVEIIQPQQLIVGQPDQLEEASCFSPNGTVVAIPVSGGLYEEENLDPENIAYIIEILDSNGNTVNLDGNNINYEIVNQRFVIKGLQGATSYTFLISSGEVCNAEVKSFTTLTPPEINPGEAPQNLECGTKIISLSAAPVDPALGIGSWSYENGKVDRFSDPAAPNSSFTGEPGQPYTLTWSIISQANPSCSISENLTVTFPEDCSKLDFDGIDDYVYVPDDNNKFDRGASFTVEAWVKPHYQSLTGTKTIISKRDPSDSNLGYDLILNNGAPSFRVRNKSVISTYKLKADRWYHLAGVFSDNNEIRIYVDGILIQTSTNIPGGTGNSNFPFTIGATYLSNSLSKSKNNFAGWIEEVRFWDKVLSEEQLHILMNQRIEVQSNPLKGETLPLDIPGGLLWDNLLGYYRLIALNYDANDDLAKYGVRNGITLDLANNAIDGQLRNIKSNQNNSAPLPYESETDGNWRDRNTWDQNVGEDEDKFWTWPNDTGINGEDINWNIVNIRSTNDLTHVSNNKEMKLLGLLADGNLTMEGTNSGPTLMSSNGSGSGLNITRYLLLNGKIDLNGESQLVQGEESILDIGNTGYIMIDQQGTANSFNYNYWSSPVYSNITAPDKLYTIFGVMKDGTNLSNNPPNISFLPGVTIADGAKTNPTTISTRWLYSFNNETDVVNEDDYSKWNYLGDKIPLKIGEGYTMKGTSGALGIQVPQNYTFKGKPNNGNIELEVGPSQNYLIGNPYPSAISVAQFFEDNLASPNGTNSSNAFNGALYFWDHFGGDPLSHDLRDYVGGYAVRNKIGAVPAISNDERIGSGDNNTGKLPGDYIPVGQGFFINTGDDISSELTSTGGTIHFTNEQRIYKTESQDDSQFLKPEQPRIKGSDENSKIRLDFSSPMGYHRQILVGTSEYATNGFDIGYDAALNDYSEEDFFWLINNYEYVIQGVSNFNPDQVLPIGVYISQAGEAIIEINELENIPNDTNIYLLDLETKLYHDLRESEFKIELEPGAYYERFQIVFEKKDDESEEEETEEESNPDGEEEGSVDPKVEPELNTSLDIMYMSTSRELAIINPDNLEIQKVVIYNLLGQKIQEFEDLENKKIMKLGVKEYPAAVYVVKMYSEKGEMSKNIILMK